MWIRARNSDIAVLRISKARKPFSSFVKLLRTVSGRVGSTGGRRRGGDATAKHRCQGGGGGSVWRFPEGEWGASRGISDAGQRTVLSPSRSPPPASSAVRPAPLMCSWSTDGYLKDSKRADGGRPSPAVLPSPRNPGGRHRRRFHGQETCRET